jgi:tetratricopeptide (TPR) repeat protein
MQCNEVQENLYDYLTGRISHDLRPAVTQHVMFCPACRKELDELKITLDLLDHSKLPKVSEGFTEKVMQSLEPKVIPFRRRPVVRYVMQGAVAAIVVLAIVSIIKLKPTTAPDTSTIRGGTTTSIMDAGCRNAVELYNRGTSNTDFKQKEALLQQALAAGCTDNKVLARIHNNLADCSEQQGSLDDAIAGYTKALEFDPQLYTAHLGMGDIYKKQGQIQAAIPQYENALSLLNAAAPKDENMQEQIRNLKIELSDLKKHKHRKNF